MGSDRNKLLLPLLGKPLIAWTLLAVKQSRSIAGIGIIGQPYDWDDFKAVVEALDLLSSVQFIQGGATRQASVHCGLKGLPSGTDRVLIHDGARCLATPNLFDRCAAALGDCTGLIAAIPVKDTIKVVNAASLIESTPDRSQLWAAQTPQGFAVKELLHCHETAVHQGWEVTDDAALFEQCNLPVKIVSGEETNLKVTTPVDLAIAELILQQRLQAPTLTQLS